MHIANQNKLTLRSGDADLNPGRIQSDLTTRNYSLRMETLDEKTRSVEAVIATEARVKVIDWERYEVIEEILLMDGCRMPADKQVPMLDSHDRSTVQKMLGSTRNLRIENGQLIGRNVYGTTPACEHAWSMVRDGHLKDNSIGYRVEEAVRIDAGKKATVNNREFIASPSMSLRVGTVWTVKENSNCPVGADDNAKMRQELRPSEGQQNSLRKENTNMFKEWLQARGLDYDTLTEAQRTALQKDFDAEQARAAATPPASTPPAAVAARTDDSGPDALKIAADASRTAIENERKRAADIRKLGKECGIDSETVERCVNDGLDLNATRGEFLTALRGNRNNTLRQAPAGIVIDQTVNRQVLSDALCMRAGLTGAIEREDKANADKRLSAASRVRDISLLDVCRHACLMDGIAVPEGREELIQRAFSTNALTQILGGTYAKSVMLGYQSLETTWQRWCNVGSSSDFKTFTRVNISGDGGLTQVTPSGEIEIGAHGEEYEQGKLKTYGKRDTFSRQDIINDDLTLLAKTPMRRGQDAQRLINDLAYEAMMSNPTMTDGIALFYATTHVNLITSSALAEGTLQTAITKFRQQKGKNKKPVRVTPRFLLVPPELEFTARRLCESQALIAIGLASTSAASTQADKNVLNGLLQVIVEESLSNSAFTNYSATSWYVVGNGANNEADTVEVTFLNGQQQPTIRTFNNIPGVLGIQFEAFIDCQAKALNWRAMLKATA